MNIDEHGEEILEALWIKTLEEKTAIGATEFRGRQTLAQLIENGLVTSDGDGSLSLTEKGLP
ncbi:MAG: hypothetical protein E4H31_00020 [Dehalococcoidia bacterium]|nr:MAG: hypothetical protein E4H31_00020 [Dehalococcoidia bacterium]